MLFCEDFDLVWPGAFWPFWLKKALWALRRPNGLCHTIIYVLVTPWRENDIFGYFKVRNMNRGQTKYSINNYPFIFWCLECNERCRIKNMISDFVAPKLRAEATYGSRPVLPGWKYLLQLLLKYFLDLSTSWYWAKLHSFSAICY